MKKVFVFICIFLLLTAIGLVTYQFVFAGREKGALQLTATPESKVYLNGELIGTTPLCRCPESDVVDAKNTGEMLPVGEYSLRLVPTKGNFPEFNEKITIEKSVLTVVDRKFASGASSEGVVISLTKLKNDKDNELIIVSLPDKADVYLDESLQGQTPLSIKDLTPSEHSLRIEKPGYKTKSVRIRATDGYKLITKGYLGIDTSRIAGEKTASPAADIAVTPTSAISVAKVRILETGTGFLRVRDTNSLGGKEIGRVSPGEEFVLLEEQPGWYQIEIAGGQKGWINSQYVEKVE